MHVLIIAAVSPFGSPFGVGQVVAVHGKLLDELESRHPAAGEVDPYELVT